MKWTNSSQTEAIHTNQLQVGEEYVGSLPTIFYVSTLVKVNSRLPLGSDKAKICVPRYQSERAEQD